MGKRLKALRVGTMLSKAKMGEILGSTQSSINCYKNGQSAPPVSLLRAYADYFDISMDYIFARTDKPQGKLYEYKPKVTPVNNQMKQKEQLELSILQAELQRPKYTHEQMTHYIEQFKYGDVDNMDYQRKIIDVFVNAIYLYDNKIVFVYNYKDGTETVTLKEVEAALGLGLSCSCKTYKHKISGKYPLNAFHFALYLCFGLLFFLLLRQPLGKRFLPFSLT